MNRFKKTGLLIISLFIVAALLCGCGTGADKGAANDEGRANYGIASDEFGSETAQSAEKSAKASSQSAQVEQNRKIIEYVDLTVETKAFDKLIDDIKTAVKQAGGYIENSEIEGNSYYGTDRRTAELKVRIPKAKQSDFSGFLSENANVVNQSVNTEDVTDRYIDTQSRIKALTLEKETLEKLLTQSSGISDTLTVYERLTDVIAEIESYQSKLNQMDNLIDYTTFTVYIEEVEKETKIEKQNWFVRTWNALLDNFSDVGNGLLNFLSFIISALPYLILLGIIAVVIILIVRRLKRKRAKKLISRFD